MSLSNRFAYVGVSEPPSVQRVDLLTGKVVRTIKLAGGIPWSIAVTPDGKTAYVTESNWPSSSSPGEVVPIDISHDTVGAPIKVGLGPVAIVITPNGRTAYVANMGTMTYKGGNGTVVDDFTVTPIEVATNRPLPSIRVCPGPGALAMSPDGSTVYVACTGTPSDPSHDIVPIDVKTGKIGKPIAVGVAPMAIAITADGKTGLMANSGWPQAPDKTITPVDLGTWQAMPSIQVGLAPFSIAVTPDGKTAYVVDDAYQEGTTFYVTPVDLGTATAGTPIQVGPGPVFTAMSPDGRTDYVVNMGALSGGAGPQAVDTPGNTLTRIATSTNTTEPPIHVGTAPTVIAFLPRTSAG